MLQFRVGPVLSNVFQNAKTHLSKIFHSIFLNIKVLPLSSKYSNFVSMLNTSQRYYSNVQTYVINDNTQPFRFCIGFSLIYPKKIHAGLICFHYFCILLVQSKHNNIKIQVGISRTMSSRSNSSCYQSDNELVSNICTIFFSVKSTH